MRNDQPSERSNRDGGDQDYNFGRITAVAGLLAALVLIAIMFATSGQV